MARLGSRTVALIGVVVVLTACGTGAGEETEEAGALSPAADVTPSAAETAAPTESASTSAEASASPAGEAELAVGWAPAPFTITAPADWSVLEGNPPTAVDVVDGTGLRYVLTAISKAPDAPDVWVQRLTTHEAIDAGAPEPVEVGGAEGVVFDAQVNDAAPACAAGGSAMGGTCVIIHGPTGGWVWLIQEGRTARIWVLDVNGETVMLFTDAREDRFESWKATIDEVVATLEWGQP